jgi:hypothetical protein
MRYIVYPPQETDAVLTAKAAILHLGDHFQAFLNANNISSWAPTDDYTLRDDRVADVLVYLGTAKGMSIAQIKYRAKRLVKVVKSSGGAMKLTFAYNVVANCLGYESYNFAFRCRSIDHYVENLWPLGVISNNCLFKEEGVVKWPSSSVTQRMRDNLKFNKARADVVNKIRRKGKKERSEKESEFLRVSNNAITRRACVPVETRN